MKRIIVIIVTLIANYSYAQPCDTVGFSQILRDQIRTAYLFFQQPFTLHSPSIPYDSIHSVKQPDTIFPCYYCEKNMDWHCYTISCNYLSVYPDTQIIKNNNTLTIYSPQFNKKGNKCIVICEYSNIWYTRITLFYYKKILKKWICISSKIVGVGHAEPYGRANLLKH